MKISIFRTAALENRIIGLDCLRILCMVMVIILHILGQGGVLNEVSPGSANYHVAWALECICFCAVDCYALLSGYLSVCKSHPLHSKLVLLWLEVVFYSAIYVCIFRIIAPEFTGKRELLNALFPIMRRQYWYFTAFFALSFFAPIINAGIRDLNRRTATLMIVLIFAVFSVLPTLLCADPFQLKGGYSALWVVVLYILGSLLNKGELQRRVAPSCCAIVFLLSTSITFLLRDILPVSIPGIGTISPLNYTSPTVLISAVSLLFLMSYLRVSSKMHRRILLRLSRASFGVYILHTNPLVWTFWFYPGILNRVAKLTPWVFPFLVIVLSALVYLLCFAIDSLREFIFQKLRIRSRFTKIEKRILLMLASEKDAVGRD